MKVRALVAMSLLVLAGCEKAGRKEAADLDRAVAAYREAENARKPDLAARISGVACAQPDVCDARDKCVVTAKATGEGLAKKHAVEAFMANELPKLEKGDPKALEMLVELDAAEKLMITGRDTLPPCDEAMRAIRKAYDLR